MQIFDDFTSVEIELNNRLYPLVQTVMPRKRNQVLAFDPGETTGIVYLEINLTDKIHLEYGQLKTPTIEEAVFEVKNIIKEFINMTDPNIRKMVIENYRVYGWKAESHAWDSLTTAKLVGVLQSLALFSDTPCTLRMAHTPKYACNDQNLKSWGFDIPPKDKHAKDALRHALYEIFWPDIAKDNK